MENQLQNHNVRDISNLYTPQITYNCALGLGSNNSSPCVVCAYKIGLFDVALDKEFTRRVPNKRPETCPRSNLNSSSSSLFVNNHKSKIKKRKRQQEQSLESTSNDTLVGYEKGMNILTVGDGDFSFSLNLARKLLSSNENEKTISETTRIVATSYESKATLLSTYPNIQDTISELEDLGVHLFYQIDATKLNSYRHLFFDNGDESMGDSPHQSRSNDSSCFQRIVWNFPCSAEPNGQDGQNSEMELNKQMVRTFIKEVSSFHPKTEVTTGKQKERSSLVSQSLLDSNCGEIHMTHKTKPPYNQWEMEDIANFVDSENSSSEGLRVEYLGRIVFDRCCYFPYVPRKALDKKSFPCHDACVYIFVPSPPSFSLSKRNTIYRENNNSPNSEQSSSSITSLENSKCNTGVYPVTKQMVSKIRKTHLEYSLLSTTKSKQNQQQKKMIKKSISRNNNSRNKFSFETSKRRKKSL